MKSCELRGSQAASSRDRLFAVVHFTSWRLLKSGTQPARKAVRKLSKTAAPGLADSQSTVLSAPPVPGMNSAHSWHTMRLR
jgi:hypothetical protein